MNKFEKHNNKKKLSIGTYRINKHVLCMMIMLCYRLEQKFKCFYNVYE